MNPSVIWAQRRDTLILTFKVQDVKEPEIKIENNKLHFTCTCYSNKDVYDLTIEFFREVNPVANCIISPSRVEVIVTKEDKGPYWPRLLKDGRKQHWLRTDFDKWMDEIDEKDKKNTKDTVELLDVLPDSDYEVEVEEGSNFQAQDVEDNKEKGGGDEWDMTYEENSEKKSWCNSRAFKAKDWLLSGTADEGISYEEWLAEHESDYNGTYEEYLQKQPWKHKQKKKRRRRKKKGSKKTAGLSWLLLMTLLFVLSVFFAWFLGSFPTN